MGLETQGRTYTERVYDYMLEMVAEHQLFNYADFGFVDETEGMKYIGKTNRDRIGSMRLRRGLRRSRS